MPDVPIIKIGSTEYTVKDPVARAAIDEGCVSVTKYLYKSGYYYNGSAEVALAGYSLYKIPLKSMQVLWVQNKDEDTPFWGQLNSGYSVYVNRSGRYSVLGEPRVNNWIGGRLWTKPYDLIAIGGSDIVDIMICVKDSLATSTIVYLDHPIVEGLGGKLIAQKTDFVTTINRPGVSIFTRMWPKNPNGYFDTFGYGYGAYVIPIKAGDRIEFDKLQTGFSWYGTFIPSNSRSSAQNINNAKTTFSQNGVLFVFGAKDEENIDQNARLYSNSDVYVAADHVVGGSGESDLPLAGKKIVFFGDSIVYRWTWEEMVTNAVGGTPINCGIGSTPLSGSDANAFWQETRLNTVKNANPDYIVILGGANDLVLNPVIGSSSDLTSKDTSKFIGAYSYIINNLLTWKPSVKIVIMSTTYAHNDGADYSQTVRYKDFAAASKLVAEYYKLPYVDLYNESGFNSYTMGSGANAIYADDHIHPNGNGSKIIASMVVDKLKQIACVS